MKIVSVSPMLANLHPDNAGEQYLLQLYRALNTSDLLVIAPRTPRSLRAVQPGVAKHLLLPVREEPRFGPLRRIHGVWRRAFAVSPHAGFARALQHSADARRALAEADVVDVQWGSSQLLLPVLRRLAPRAQLVLTLHDITSQQKARELAAARGARARTMAAAGLLQARWLERRAHVWADELVVLSEKDRALLPFPESATVIYPAIAADSVVPSDDEPHANSHRVLFVGPLWRDANREGVQWLVEKVWPAVRRAVPEAELYVAGSLPEGLVPLVPQAAGVTYAGFVDDLDALYSSAAVLAAPLHQGAGVKFKVLEAIARGVPTALTSVAAEGIGDARFVPHSDDSVEGFAAQLIEALRDPHTARDRARTAARWAIERYGWDQFQRRVAAVYGPASTGHDEMEPSLAFSDGEGAVPPVTVVIPTRNGAATLNEQLDAIAREPEAGELEVIISDNGSTDRTITVARSNAHRFGSLRVIDSSTVAGVAHARNAGASAARSARVMFIDADDEIHPGFIGHILRALDTAHAAGAAPVAGRLGSAAPGAVDVSDALRLAPFGNLQYALGGACGIHTDVLLKLGGFDESFSEGHEEVDFFWRLQLAGYDLVGVPEATFDYRQRPTARSSFRQFRRYARSAEQLRSRYLHSLDLTPTTVKGAVKQLVRKVLSVPQTARRHGAISVARGLGWSVGMLEGSIRFRHASPSADSPPLLIVENEQPGVVRQSAVP